MKVFEAEIVRLEQDNKEAEDNVAMVTERHAEETRILRQQVGAAQPRSCLVRCMLKIKVAELQECSPTEDNKREYQTKVGQFCWLPNLVHD